MAKIMHRIVQIKLSEVREEKTQVSFRLDAKFENRETFDSTFPAAWLPGVSLCSWLYNVVNKGKLEDVTRITSADKYYMCGHFRSSKCCALRFHNLWHIKINCEKFYYAFYLHILHFSNFVLPLWELALLPHFVLYTVNIILTQYSLSLFFSRFAN